MKNENGSFANIEMDDSYEHLIVIEKELSQLDAKINGMLGFYQGCPIK